MRLHFCESCHLQFSAEGELPQGAILCPDCREKTGAVPHPSPGRTNRMLRASLASGVHRRRSGSHASPPTRGKAGLSAATVWGGILALAAMIGLLLCVLHRINVDDKKRDETGHPEHKDAPLSVTTPDSNQSANQDGHADEAAFGQLMTALSQLPNEDRAARLAALEGFVKAYPESSCAARVRDMIRDMQDKPAPQPR